MACPITHSKEGEGVEYAAVQMFSGDPSLEMQHKKVPM